MNNYYQKDENGITWYAIEIPGTLIWRICNDPDGVKGGRMEEISDLTGYDPSDEQTFNNAKAYLVDNLNMLQ